MESKSAFCSSIRPMHAGQQAGGSFRTILQDGRARAIAKITRRYYDPSNSPIEESFSAPIHQHGVVLARHDECWPDFPIQK